MLLNVAVARCRHPATKLISLSEFEEVWGYRKKNSTAYFIYLYKLITKSHAPKQKQIQRCVSALLLPKIALYPVHHE